MIIYLILFALIVLLYQPLSKDDREQKIYCIIVCIALTLVVGLRNENMGLTDTAYVYKTTYIRILNYGFTYVLTLKDSGFQILTFIFTRMFGNDFKLYVLLFTMPYMAAVSFLIYKYSHNKCLSFIMFFCLHYFEISFTLMRQINAMALLCVALYFFIEEKYCKYATFVLLAFLFHTISIVFFVLLLFKFVKIKKWMLIPLMVILGICLIYPQQTVGFAYTYLDSERFLRYESLGRTKNLTFFFINFVLWSAEALYFQKIKQNRSKSVMFICTSICLVISPLTVVLGEMSRLAYLFGIFHVVLFPDSMKIFKKGESRFYAETMVTGFLLVYFLVFLGPQVNIIPYYM